MRLKEDFLVHEIDGVQYLVPISAETFTGIIRGNASAAFIVNQLKEETTAEAIIEAMCGTYDAPRDRITADVEEILNTLRSIGALIE